ncbi:MAG TPA: enoyl-CoA hydratase-related protein [Gemmatimonadales bacterium]|nr:enoyl-CoA hydratase-related protein [Gemmatimonadales bacterium]
MSNQFIVVETAGNVRSITLNRPEVLNSCHSPMAAELQAALAEAGEDGSIRAVLLTGAGRAFCAGQDLDEARPVAGEPPRDFAAHVRQVYNPVVRALRQLPKPVIAAVNGVAAGAGANLALACDFVFASSQASFIQAFSRIGLVPDTGGTFFLPRLVGLARATAMTMLAEKVTARQAFEYGMIYRVVEPDRLIPEARDFAASLASQATFGLGLTKRLLNASLVNDLDAQLELEADLQGAAGRSEDYSEGVTAFLEKRAPTFRGS